MTNSEKYKTANERIEAFWKFYNGSNLAFDAVEAFANWLDLEAPEEKPLPCPFCGRDVEIVTPYSGSRKLACITCMCGYHSNVVAKDVVVASHNRVAKDVKESEVTK